MLSQHQIEAALRDLPRLVRVVCARRKLSQDSSTTRTVRRLMKAKSEQLFAQTSRSGSSSRNRSRSLESKFSVCWSELKEVHLINGERGLGLIISEDTVSGCDYVRRNYS